MQKGWKIGRFKKEDVMRKMRMSGVLFVISVTATMSPIGQREHVKLERSLIESIKEKVRQTPKDVDVQLVKLLGNFLKTIKLPLPAKKIFNTNMSLRNMKILDEIPQNKYVRSGIGLTGTTLFNNVPLVCIIYVLIDTEFRPQFILSVELPAGYKVADLFPLLHKLDTLSLPRIKLVFSTMDLLQDALTLMFKRPEVAMFQNISLSKGLNFFSSLDLSGPLTALARLKTLAKKLDAITIRHEPIYLKGVIPFKVTDTAMSAIIPIRFGIDFMKIEKIPDSVSDIFREFSTDDLGLDLEFPFKLTLEMGVRIVLGTQDKPIRLSSVVALGKNSFSLGQRIRNQLELEWLSIGDAGFQIDFDTKVMSAMGLPFSGLGVYGKIQLGKEGKSRAAFEVSAGLQIKKDEFPGLLWHLQAQNIRFDDLIELLITIAQKKNALKAPFPEDRIPVIHINEVKGYLATSEVRIARKIYQPGFALAFDIDMFDQKALLDVTIIADEKPRMEGVGYLSNIELKNKKGNPVFSLTGPGLDQKYNTKDDGPVVFCSFDTAHPGSGALGIRGMLEIPPLSLKSKVDFVRSKLKMKAELEQKIAGFTTVLQFDFDPLQFKNMFIKIGFKDDFEQFLFKALKEALTEANQKLKVRLEDINKKVSALSERIKKEGERIEKAEESKAKQIENEIGELESKITELTETIRASKPGVAEREARQKQRKLRLELDEKKLYLKTIVKPEEKIVSTDVKISTKITKEVTDAKLLQKTIQTTVKSMNKLIDATVKGVQLIQLKEAVGSYSMDDMLAGKSPKLDKLEIKTSFPGFPPKTITLTDVQFDFKKPLRAASHIAEQIINKVGLKV